MCIHTWTCQIPFSLPKTQFKSPVPCRSTQQRLPSWLTHSWDSLPGTWRQLCLLHSPWNIDRTSKPRLRNFSQRGVSFVCKPKWTANGDLCICQCIWLPTRDRLCKHPALSRACYAKHVCAGKWCCGTSAPSQGGCVGRLCGCVGGRNDRVEKERSLRELTHAGLAKKYQPLCISTPCFPSLCPHSQQPNT